MSRKKLMMLIITILGLSALVFSRMIGSDGGSGGTAVQPPKSGAGKNGSVASGDGKQIRVSVSMGDKEFGLLSSMAESFEDTHAGVVIQLENVKAADAYSTWKKASQMGEAPDLMLLDNEWVEEFAALGFLQPCDEYFSSDDQNSHIAILMNQIKWNGNIWGIPKDVDPYILVWNKEAALKRGLSHAPLNSEELIAWNKAWMKPDEESYGIYWNPDDVNGFIALSSSLTGAWLFPDKLWTDEGAAQKTLHAFLAPQEENWTGKAFAHNYPMPTSEWQPWDELRDGRLAAMITTVSAYNREQTDGLEMSGIPSYSGMTHNVWLKGRSFVISSRSEESKVLMEFVKNLTLPDAQIRYWTEAHTLPAQIATYNLTPLRGDVHIRSYDWLIREGRVFPGSTDVTKRVLATKDELSKLWHGDVNLKEWIEAIGKLWDEKTASLVPSTRVTPNPSATPTLTSSAAVSVSPTSSPTASSKAKDKTTK